VTEIDEELLDAQQITALLRERLPAWLFEVLYLHHAAAMGSTLTLDLKQAE